MVSGKVETTTRDREPLSSLLLYRLLKWTVVSPLAHGYFRARIHGSENVPMSGPLIVVSNHASDCDPPIVAHAMGRPVAFMAKEELFKVPLLAPAIRLYGAYPVKRGTGDRGAIRAAIEAIEEGWAAGVFLDGTRRPDGRLHSPKLGAALIAAKTQALLLPVSLWGTERIFADSKFPQSAPVTVRIGQPIAPPKSSDRDALETVTQQCVDAIHALHDLGR